MQGLAITQVIFLIRSRAFNVTRFYLDLSQNFIGVRDSSRFIILYVLNITICPRPIAYGQFGQFHSCHVSLDLFNFRNLAS